MHPRSTLIVLLVAHSLVVAQGVGPGSPTETFHELAPITQLPEDPPLWRANVGLLGDPLSVSLDAASPVWTKRFHALDGYSPIHAGDNLILSEAFTISGDQPWTGWRAYSANPDLEWIVGGYIGTIGGGTNFEALDIPLLEVTIESMPADPLPGFWLNFSFPPLYPGTGVLITMHMEYQELEPLEVFSVTQFPVPEPSSAVLMGLAVATLLRRRRVRISIRTF